MPRTLPHVFAVAIGFAAMATLPVLAADAPAVSSVSGGEKLVQTLTRLSAQDGFELRGLDKVGDETVKPPKSGATVQALRKMLSGYAYTVEFAPADPTGKTPRKLARVSILGHTSEVAGEAPQPALAASTATADAGQSPSAAPADGSAPLHPVNHLLQSLARASLPIVPPQAETSSQPAVPASVPGAYAGAATGPAAASSPSPSSPTMDPVNNPADMAALTQQASANLGALVQSLKSACPAGSKC